MTFLPIVERELRLASRRRRTYWVRVGAAALAALTALALLSPSFRGLQPPGVGGARFFHDLSLAAFMICLLAGTFVTADCLSTERRDETLPLLFLTRLKGHDVAMGKLIAVALNPFFGLLAVLPILGLPVLIGGVSGGEFWRMTVVLTNALFFSLTAGLFVSAISYSAFKAVMGTLTVLVVLCGLAGLQLVSGGPGWLRWSATLSPALGWYYAFDSSYATSPPTFLASVSLTHGLAWAWLWLAGWSAPRRLENPTEREPTALLRWVRERSLASRKRRVVQDQLWLESNPLLWLARRERFLLFRAFLVGAGLLWFVGLRLCGGTWLRAEIGFGAMTLLHTVIKCWVAVEASRRLVDARQSGELELLLVTPLSVHEILQGRIMRLKHQFAVPAVLVLGTDALLSLFGVKSAFALGPMNLWAVAFPASIGMFAIDSYAIVWLGMHHGLTSRNSIHGFLKTIGQIMVLPWVIFLITTVMLGGVLNSSEWLVLWWLFIGAANSMLWIQRTSNRLEEHFRVDASG